MTIKVEWDNDEQTIIRWTYLKGWDWTDIYLARDEEYRLVESVGHTVNAIGDLQAASVIPPNALASVKKALSTRHPRLGITVLVSSHLFVNVMYKMLDAVYPALVSRGGLVLATSEQDAYELIAAHARQRQP